MGQSKGAGSTARPFVSLPFAGLFYSRDGLQVDVQQEGAGLQAVDESLSSARVVKMGVGFPEPPDKKAREWDHVAAQELLGDDFPLLGLAPVGFYDLFHNESEKFKFEAEVIRRKGHSRSRPKSCNLVERPQIIQALGCHESSAGVNRLVGMNGWTTAAMQEQAHVLHRLRL